MRRNQVANRIICPMIKTISEILLIHYLGNTLLQSRKFKGQTSIAYNPSLFLSFKFQDLVAKQQPTNKNMAHLSLLPSVAMITGKNSYVLPGRWSSILEWTMPEVLARPSADTLAAFGCGEFGKNTIWITS